MKNEYIITGMTCGGCVAKVKDKLEGIKGIQSVHVQLEAPQAVVQMVDHVPVEEIQAELSSAGHYSIEEKLKPHHEVQVEELPETSMTTYKPLILIVIFIAGITLLTQFPFEQFSFSLWMRHFMAGFFIVFAFFKLLNLRGFADSYQMYDVVAVRWKSWGLIYPFIELTLGLLYLLNINPLWTNVSTIVILGVSSIGVIKSNLDKRKIKCACLGDVFNLPMSTVTIIEDLSMVAMAVFMLSIR